MTGRLVRAGRAERLRAARDAREDLFDLDELKVALVAEIHAWSCGPSRRNEAWAATTALLGDTAPSAGEQLTRAQWWQQRVGIPDARKAVSPDAGVRALVMGRFVLPSWTRLATARVEHWVSTLPEADPLVRAHHQLIEACAAISWTTPAGRARAVRTGLRLMLAGDHDHLAQLRDQDLRRPDRGANGTDVLDAALCGIGVFSRSPRRGTTRHRAGGPKPISELVAARTRSRSAR